MDHIKTLVPEEVRKEMVDARISTSGVQLRNAPLGMCCNCASICLLKLLLCMHECEAMFVVMQSHKSNCHT